MLIKNGLIVSPGNQLEQPADLRIRNGIIETIAAANSLTAEPDEQVLDDYVQYLRGLNRSATTIRVLLTKKIFIPEQWLRQQAAIQLSSAWQTRSRWSIRLKP